jgi:hypothetical protein
MDLGFNSTAERMRRDRRIPVGSLNAEVLAWVNSRFKDEE